MYKIGYTYGTCAIFSPPTRIITVLADSNDVPVTSQIDCTSCH